MLYIANRKREHTAETQRQLHAADGYLYLNMPQEALEELEAIQLPEQRNPDVLLARIRVLLHMHCWSEAEALSQASGIEHPEEEEFTVQRAFALHQMQQSAVADEVLLAAPEWLRRTGILHYNLACYEARLGNLSIARQCVKTAIEINAAMKKNASIDPDLEALWN
ncbi:MAG: hypothetical protein JWL90_2815 [Chthoniobacteraceae bacterium]|nr:hypothetical protein [Chthoniobacteraceae bacterium]